MQLKKEGLSLKICVNLRNLRIKGLKFFYPQISQVFPD